jgi:hypothetical protein
MSRSWRIDVVKTAAQKTEELRAQCEVWCATMRLKPIKLERGGSFERSAILMAVHQTDKGFSDLNSNQRCLIAGLEDD